MKQRHLSKTINLIVAICITFTAIGIADTPKSNPLILEAYGLSTERTVPMLKSNNPDDLIVDEEPPPEEKELTIEELISKTCADYGIDDSIVLAIAKVETGHFTSYAYLNQNNPGGMSINEVPITYDTIEEGVEAFVSNLAENYFGIGLTTVEEIAQKYCPVNAAHWISMVSQLR